jgi:mRNA-degrading endonuclease RelE of RelBE toxin-antitoxin system
MAYNLIITDEMEKLLNERIEYLLKVFKSEQAATHLLNGVDEIYNLLETNPYVYSESQDAFMKALHYHEAKVPQMNYILIYKIDEEKNAIYVLGIFNTRENYSDKIKISTLNK